MKTLHKKTSPILPKKVSVFEISTTLVGDYLNSEFEIQNK